jgi:pimeloyl-ACP methyl ester carboxylesterase
MLKLPVVSCLAIAAWILLAGGAAAQEEPLPGNYNIAWKTTGGLQYWGDELVYSGWRIQRNALTGHCRLLDGDDRRQAWGSLEECQKALKICHERGDAKPLSGHVVLVIHGLAGARPLLKSMCRYLSEEGDLQAVSICYPSTRCDVDADAAALKRIIDGMPEVTRIDLVAHSLGCIVIRRYLAMEMDAEAGRKPDPRIRRFVMLAPPNHGAPEAARLAAIDKTGQIAGPAAHQLTAGFAELEPKLATPSCEFGILAGGRGDETGYNPLVAGDDDGVVPLASAKLAGARDFRLVPAMHVRFPRDKQVQELTLKFLQDGCFETEDKRQPL